MAAAGKILVRCDAHGRAAASPRSPHAVTVRHMLARRTPCRMRRGVLRGRVRCRLHVLRLRMRRRSMLRLRMRNRRVGHSLM
jgi:hypothetical protein